MNVLVTGARGFIGSNLCEWLKRRPDANLLTFGRENTDQELRERLAIADFVYHLAGVNRPDSEAEFQTVNVGLTARICRHLLALDHAIPIVFASSAQAVRDNPYGLSKRQAELVLAQHATQSDAWVIVYRLKNVFGKWSRPNYNSVVATFCYNIARDLPISISDPECALDLVYIDDVIRCFVKVMDAGAAVSGMLYPGVTPLRRVTLGRLAELLLSFREMRRSLVLPDLSDQFVRKLYGTYLSYLNPSDLTYALDKKCDTRGCLAEFVKADTFGQIFVSRTKPGVVRGNHYHHTKAEKFLVLEGHAAVRFRHVRSGEAKEYEVRGEDMCVLDIPPGYAHSIENLGLGVLVTLFWASGVFDPQNPDTYSMET